MILFLCVERDSDTRCWPPILHDCNPSGSLIICCGIFASSFHFAKKTTAVIDTAES